MTDSTGNPQESTPPPFLTGDDVVRYLTSFRKMGCPCCGNNGWTVDLPPQPGLVASIIAYPMKVGPHGPIMDNMLSGAPYPLVTARCANCSMVFLFPYTVVQQWITANPTT